MPYAVRTPEVMEKERARCRAYYVANRERMIAQRLARYYADHDREKERSRIYAQTYRKKVYKPRPAPTKSQRLNKLDDRWAGWARDLGIAL